MMIDTIQTNFESIQNTQDEDLYNSDLNESIQCKLESFHDTVPIKMTRFMGQSIKDIMNRFIQR